MENINDSSIEKFVEEYKKELREGLRERKLTIDDVERMLGQRLSEIKEALVSQTGEILTEESSDNEANCEECGKTLKKTKKRDSP